MRDLKTLYQLVLDNFDKTWCHGTCMKLYDLKDFKILTQEEINIIIKDFHSNRKIKWWSRFYYHGSFISSNVGYWWDNNHEGHQQRKKYLQHIINKL